MTIKFAVVLLISLFAVGFVNSFFLVQQKKMFQPLQHFAQHP